VLDLYTVKFTELASSKNAWPELIVVYLDAHTLFTQIRAGTARSTSHTHSGTPKIEIQGAGLAEVTTNFELVYSEGPMQGWKPTGREVNLNESSTLLFLHQDQKNRIRISH
jgi:hypothetical protein